MTTAELSAKPLAIQAAMRGGVAAGTIVGTVLSFLSIYRELVTDRDVDDDGPGTKR